MLDVRRKAHHTILGVLTAAVALLLHSASLAAVPAAPSVITNITVIIKPGKQSGRAMATGKGKTANIAANTVQAWTIQQGQAALLLLAPLKKGQPYRVRYYELDAGKSRLLGYVPFAQAKLAESKTTGPMWAFALNGVDPLSKEPVIFAGDTEAIHARLDSASEPVFSSDSLSFRSSGGPATVLLPALMGWDVRGVIFAPTTADPQAAYLEFLSNGDSLTINPSSQVERGRLLTDGKAFRIAPTKGPAITWQRSALHLVSGIPAAHRIDCVPTALRPSYFLTIASLRALTPRLQLPVQASLSAANAIPCSPSKTSFIAGMLCIRAFRGALRSTTIWLPRENSRKIPAIGNRAMPPEHSTGWAGRRQPSCAGSRLGRPPARKAMSWIRQHKRWSARIAGIRRIMRSLSREDIQGSLTATWRMSCSPDHLWIPTLRMPTRSSRRSRILRRMVGPPASP
jgi:hypothetical protein